MIHTSGAELMRIPVGWAVVEERLMREFEFADFSEAKKLVDAMSLHAESVNHHPEIHFGWGYVIVELFTHDEGKITEKDTSFAIHVNTIVEGA